MQNKSTNFELLRIILTLFIPVYHWLLYNGIFYADNSANNIYSIIPFTGIPFSCLFAFITMSAYFLTQKKYHWNIKKVYSFIALTLSLWLFKTIVIHSCFPGEKMNYYVDTFFLKGAWWYVYPYILLMIFYPLLNHFIYTSSSKKLYLATSICGVLFLIAGITNKTIFINDCIMFLFMYLLIGCIQRNSECPIFHMKHAKKLQIGIYIFFVVLLTMLSIYLKLPNNGIGLELENMIYQRLHTRYNLFGLISGILLFYIAKDIKVPYIPSIHRVSKMTLFIFLLHETVMCIFWTFEIKSCEFLAYLPTAEFFGLLLIYMIFCILGAAMMYKVYYTWIDPLWNKLIDRLCQTNFSKKLETIYEKLEEK